MRARSKCFSAQGSRRSCRSGRRSPCRFAPFGSDGQLRTGPFVVLTIGDTMLVMGIAVLLTRSDGSGICSSTAAMGSETVSASCSCRCSYRGRRHGAPTRKLLPWTHDVSPSPFEGLLRRPGDILSFGVVASSPAASARRCSARFCCTGLSRLSADRLWASSWSVSPSACGTSRKAGTPRSRRAARLHVGMVVPATAQRGRAGREPRRIRPREILQAVAVQSLRV